MIWVYEKKGETMNPDDRLLRIMGCMEEVANYEGRLDPPSHREREMAQAIAELAEVVKGQQASLVAIGSHPALV